MSLIAMVSQPISASSLASCDEMRDVVHRAGGVADGALGVLAGGLHRLDRDAAGCAGRSAHRRCGTRPCRCRRISARRRAPRRRNNGGSRAGSARAAASGCACWAGPSRSLRRRSQGSSFRKRTQASKVAPPQASSDQKPTASSLPQIGSMSSVRMRVAMQRLVGVAQDEIGDVIFGMHDSASQSPDARRWRPQWRRPSLPAVSFRCTA